MPHDVSLISTIAVGLAFAFAGGFVAVRLGLPPIVGYLLAGVAIGPFTPGFVADTHLAPQLAEIGVMLLMFGVGMHFSIRDLVAVHRIAVPGAAVQIAVAALLGIGAARLWGWSIGTGLVFGLALSVASTVVLLRTLEERGLLSGAEARIAIGWLIVEDLLTVVALVMLPALAPSLGGNGAAVSGSLLLPLALTFGKVALFVAVMLILGARLLPWLLEQVVRTRSRELFTLAVIATALGIAFAAAELFGSAALGAFLAGIVVSESDHSHRAAEQTKPLEDAFAVLFFLSVGMLFDPGILIRHPFQVLAALAIVMLGKSLAAFAIVRVAGYPTSTALTVSVGLAQIGEFSFILADLGISHGLLSAEGRNLILAGALLSITLNPAAFSAASALRRHLERGQPA